MTIVTFGCLLRTVTFACVGVHVRIVALALNKTQNKFDKDLTLPVNGACCSKKRKMYELCHIVTQTAKQALASKLAGRLMSQFDD